MADKRPDVLHGPGADNPASAARPTTAADKETRLKTLYARWDQFANEYETARRKNDQEVMTNLRGLMLLIKREIKRLGGQLRDFPYPDGAHLADL
jgi:tRNA C32,U32 (ribose-2'-O)-methylase TrmJ